MTGHKRRGGVKAKEKKKEAKQIIKEPQVIETNTRLQAIKQAKHGTDPNPHLYMHFSQH